MKSWVVSTSILVKWFLKEDHQDEALKVLDQFQSGAFKIFVPDLAYAEFANILWKRIHFHGLDQQFGHELIQCFQALPLISIPIQTLIDPALALACRHKITVYDSIFLALAQETHSKLLTADRELYQKTKSTHKVEWISNFR